MGERKGVYKDLVRKSGEKVHLEDPRIEERILFMWIFRKWDGDTWFGLIWLRIGTGDRHLWMR